MKATSRKETKAGAPAQRRRVIEWRFTFTSGEHTIRWWIESDPAHGGASQHDAGAAASEAVRDTTDYTAPHQRARILLDMCPAANAVEVLGYSGDGAVAYRDWP